MKSPLHYQISEYDCGPTSMLNAIKFLFEREQISPELIRNIMLYSLDSYSTEGAGKSGTSRIAMILVPSDNSPFALNISHRNPCLLAQLAESTMPFLEEVW